MALGGDPYAVETWEIGTHKKPDPSAGFHLSVWAPKGPPNRTPKEVPTLLFVTGFGGSVEAKYYSSFFTKMASLGVIVVGADIDGSGVPNYVKLGSLLNTKTMDYIGSAAFLDTFGQHSGALKPDMNQMLSLGGHSAGNHIAVQSMVDGCRDVKAVVLIDPVDGVDPYGFVKQYVVHPPALLNFSTPALHVETGLDPVTVGIPTFPACAPANISNERFYRAWQGPIWQVNATKYGHISICDDGAIGPSGLVCKKPPRGTNESLYRDTVGNAVVSFLEGIFFAQPASLESLTKESTFPIDVVLKHNYNGYVPDKVKPFCRENPSSLSSAAQE